MLIMGIQVSQAYIWAATCAATAPSVNSSTRYPKQDLKILYSIVQSDPTWLCCLLMSQEQGQVSLGYPTLGEVTFPEVEMMSQESLMTSARNLTSQ
jgi:hypothetical protein